METLKTLYSETVSNLSYDELKLHCKINNIPFQKTKREELEGKCLSAFIDRFFTKQRYNEDLNVKCSNSFWTRKELAEIIKTKREKIPCKVSTVDLLYQHFYEIVHEAFLKTNAIGGKTLADFVFSEWVIPITADFGNRAKQIYDSDMKYEIISVLWGKSKWDQKTLKLFTKFCSSAEMERIEQLKLKNKPYSYFEEILEKAYILERNLECNEEKDLDTMGIVLKVFKESKELKESKVAIASPLAPTAITPVIATAIPTTTVSTTIIPTEPIVVKEVSVVSKTSRQQVPKRVKTDVWNTYISETVPKHKCLCCKLVFITNTSFDVGHVISQKNGGSMTIENLRPICSSCNGSMGTRNMREYVVEYGYLIG